MIENKNSIKKVVKWSSIGNHYQNEWYFTSEIAYETVALLTSVFIIVNDQARIGPSVNREITESNLPKKKKKKKKEKKRKKKKKINKKKNKKNRKNKINIENLNNKERPENIVQKGL